MNIISSLFDIIALIYILVSLCGVLSLCFDLIARKKQTQSIPLYRVFTDKVFNKLHLPLAITGILTSIINVLYNRKENTILILLSVFIAVSLITEILRELFQIKKHKKAWVPSDSEYKTVFDSIDMYYTSKKSQQGIFTEIGRKLNEVIDRISNHHFAVDAACENIDEYIKLQKYECQALLKNRDLCLSLFSTLENISRQCNDELTGFIEKINASNASIGYTANSNALLNDINNSFQMEYQHQAEHINAEIDTIVNRMNDVSFKCGQFTKLFSLFDEIIQTYSTKIGTSLDNRTTTYLSEKGEPLVFKDIIGSILQKKRKDDAESPAIDDDKKSKLEQMDYETSDNDELFRIIKEKDNEIAGLNAKFKSTSKGLSNLEKDYDKANIIIKDLSKKAEKRGNAIVAIVFIGVFIIIGLIISNNNRSSQSNTVVQEDSSNLISQNEELTAEKNELEGSVAALQARVAELTRTNSTADTRITELQRQNADLERLMSVMERPIDVASIRVGNWGNNGWITEPGGRLTAAQMRYLRPQITVNSLISGNVTFQVKVVHPDGRISTNANSAPGYSYSSSHTVSRTQNQVINLMNWGFDTQNTYFRTGPYTVEVYYNNVLLRSQRVTLY